jgi:hypothetical protein
MFRNTILPVACMIILSVQACFEEDERVSPYPGIVSTIADSIQANTSYFDLESRQLVKSHRNDAWQLGFECGDGGWHIITNCGANWFIYNTRQPLPDAAISMPDRINGLYDIQHAFPDSTAVGDWIHPQEGGDNYPRNIYLLGRFADGIFTNIKEIAFLGVNDTTYTFFYKERDSGISDTVTLVKSDSVNFIYYSFDQSGQVSLEPDKHRYDLVFGSYYDLATLFGVTIPYQVGGVFQNIWQTEAVVDSVTGYAAIEPQMIPAFNFTSRRDVPGYEWKGVTVDVAGGGTASYAVKSNFSYIIHTAEGNYFKLRFLSYTLEGRSGFPQFEYRLLE